MPNRYPVSRSLDARREIRGRLDDGERLEGRSDKVKSSRSELRRGDFQHVVRSSERFALGQVARLVITRFRFARAARVPAILTGHPKAGRLQSAVLRRDQPSGQQHQQGKAVEETHDREGSRRRSICQISGEAERA